MKLSTSILALGALSTFAHAQSQGPFNIRLQPKVGTVVRQRMTMLMSFKADAGGNPNIPAEALKSFDGMGMTLTADATTKFTKVTSNLVEELITVANMHMDGQGPLAGAAAAGAPELMKGYTVKVTMDPTNPSSLKYDLQGGKKKAGSDPLSDFFKGSPGMSFSYPKGPVMVGDYWDIGKDMLAGLGSVMGGAEMNSQDFVGITHFVATEAGQGTTIGVFETDVNGDPAVDVAGQGKMNMHMAMTGHTRIDLATGIILSAKMGGGVKMSMDLPGQGKMNMNISMTIGLETLK